MTSPLHESHLMWIHDPHPNQPPRVTPRPAVTKKNIDPVPRNNNHTVPRNTNAVSDSDARAQAPLGTIPSASWYNSSLPLSSVPTPRPSVCNPVPRNNLQQKEGKTQVHNKANGSSLPPKRKRDRKHKRERRAKERENKIESFIHDARWANQRSLVPAGSSGSDPVRPSGHRPHIVHTDGSVPASRIYR